MEEKETYVIVGKYVIETSSKTNQQYDYIQLGVLKGNEFINLQKIFGLDDLKRYVLADSGIKVLKK